MTSSGTGAPGDKLDGMDPEYQRAPRLRPEDRREQILGCAIRLFGERPYSEVSVGEIADAAGVRRPLVNHYFGGKRPLYIEVIRRFLFVPEFDSAALERYTSVPERIDAVVSQWLHQAERHRGLWLRVVVGEDVAGMGDVRDVLREADEVAATRLIKAVAPDLDSSSSSTLHAMTVAFGAMFKSGSRQWLVDGTLDRDQLRALLVATMSTILSLVDSDYRAATEAGSSPTR